MSANGSPTCVTDTQQILQHDLRHALFTLRTGIALLGQVRDDADKFSEVQQLLQHEVASATKLLNELLTPHDSPAH